MQRRFLNFRSIFFLDSQSSVDTRVYYATAHCYGNEASTRAASETVHHRPAFVTLDYFDWLSSSFYKEDDLNIGHEMS